MGVPTAENSGSRRSVPRRRRVRRRRAPPRLRRARERRREAWIGWDQGEFRVFEFSGEGFSGLIAGNPGELRGGNGGVLFGVRSRVYFRGGIGAGPRDFEQTPDFRCRSIVVAPSPVLNEPPHELPHEPMARNPHIICLDVAQHLLHLLQVQKPSVVDAFSARGGEASPRPFKP
ncbi:hypothetical protein CRG98_031926 [Punica granatum]|uniref:Uncharacterized protein n=1 Tax=Punica granatum TaxID=22663 RepID=A0A2I0IVG3_PUNGR|nr:hypothetical protein CRG98_031926 [Punica granatum]